MTLALRRPRVLALAAAILLPLTMFATTTTADAGNWYGPTGNAGRCNVYGNITDNKEVVFDYIDTSVELTNATNFTRTSLLNPTELNTSTVSDGGIHVDIEVVDRYYTDYCEPELGTQWTTNGFSGLMGMQTCELRAANNRRCDRAVVRYSNHYFDNHGQAADRWLTCHEIGHAIGLIHRNVNGCIQTGVDSATPAYTPHDIEHFNMNW